MQSTKTIFAGPYSLFKEEISQTGKNKAVISLVIFDDFEVNERFHSQGKLNNEFARP